MEHIKTETEEGLLIVTMARGKANALNSAMVEEMNSALEQAEKSQSVRAMVLASHKTNFFSGGFDVKEVFAYDRDKMTEFFGRFIDLYEGMMRLPKPVVAAVSGHAFAGGAVLALACDARVMAEGQFGFALNEINLGIVLPPGMMRMAATAVGPASAREMVLEGRAISPTRALEIGLASELASADSALDRAIARARELSEKPGSTFGATKRLLNEVAGRIGPRSDRDYLSQFIEHWFSPECSERRRALTESLS